MDKSQAIDFITAHFRGDSPFAGRAAVEQAALGSISQY